MTSLTTINGADGTFGSKSRQEIDHTCVYWSFGHTCTYMHM